MYSFNGKVRYSEVGEDAKLTISSAIDYMQDCSTFNSESLGVGLSTLMKLKRAWLLTSWQIKIYDMPGFADDITVSTWPTEFKAFMGFRNFRIADLNGKAYVEANSLWAYVDSENGKPVKPTDAEINPYRLEAPLELGRFERKVKIPDIMEKKAPVRICRYQIDTNGHVNNCEYARMAEEYIPEGRRIKEIHIEYRNPSYYGMMLYPQVGIDDENVYVTLSDESGKLCSALRFKS